MSAQRFKIMNYTTEVAAEKSILDIERLLSKAGVKSVHKEFNGGGETTAFVFSLITGHGEMFFKMPCDVDKVFTVLFDEVKKPQRGTEKRVREQANRVAWRILLDSLTADITRLKLQQVTPEQVFLSYMWNPKTGKTLFEKLESQQFLLEDGKKSRDIS